MPQNAWGTPVVRIDGGQISNGDDFWKRVAYELDLPSSTENASQSATKAGLEIAVPMVVTASGSQLIQSTNTEKREFTSLASAITYMTQEKITCGDR